MEVQLSIIGCLMIALAIMHIPFPKYFRWAEDLKGISLLNRQMMYVHTLFLGVVLFLMGLLCTAEGPDLLHTRLGHWVLLGFALFWTLRLLIQFVGYSSSLWKGKVFETTIHILFSLLWTYFTFVLWMAFNSWK
jgi:hypothetical protein